MIFLEKYLNIRIYSNIRPPLNQRTKGYQRRFWLGRELICAIINIKPGTFYSSLSQKCFISGTSKHLCDNLYTNQSISLIPANTFDKLVTEMLPVDAVNTNAKCQEWVKNVNKKSLALPTPHNLTGIFAQFSQCSPLPLIKLHIHDTTVTCTCDTGASKSLMSDTLTIYLYGVGVLTSLHTNLNCCLKDVQNKEIPVLGSLVSTFQIYDFTFHHKFVIFQAPTHEILLGYNFSSKIKLHCYQTLV